jgi:uncharacterized lipoprotein YajG
LGKQLGFSAAFDYIPAMKISRLVLIIGLVVAGCSKKPESASAKNTNDLASGNPITAPVDYLGAVAKAKKHSEKVIDTTSMNQAIQLFYAQEDRFPKDLQELVAKHYIGGIPPAPNGMRWAYNPQSGEMRAVPQP